MAGAPSNLAILLKIASGSVLCNLGFRYAAVVQEHSLAQGIDVALQKMILTRQDWLTRDG